MKTTFNQMLDAIRHRTWDLDRGAIRDRDGNCPIVAAADTILGTDYWKEHPDADEVDYETAAEAIGLTCDGDAVAAAADESPRWLDTPYEKRLRTMMLSAFGLDEWDG
jgi:hypothetical protein